MRPLALHLLLAATPAAVASTTDTPDSPLLLYEAASLISAYVPQTAYSQLTASVAAAASAASVTGDPGSLFLSALLATAPPAWFASAVPPGFSSNIGALAAAVSTLRNAAAATPTGLSSSETLVVTRTTNSLGVTETTSYTSTLPASTSGAAPTSTNAAASPTDFDHHARWGMAALALAWAAFF